MKIPYTALISLYNNKKLNLQYIELTDAIRKTYKIFLWDGTQKYETIIDEIGYISDFETKYKSLCNRKIQPIETGTGWLQVRQRSVSGDVQLKYIYFTSATSNNFDNADDSHYSITINEDHTKTIVDFMPNYSYELSGGRLRALNSDISDNTLSLNFILAPDIPENYGGNYYIIKNKKIDNTEKYFNVEEEPKIISYSSSTPTASKARLEINHSVDEQIQFEYNLKIYRI